MSREEQFSVSEPVRVEVRIASGDITVTTADVNEARVGLSGPEAVLASITVGLHNGTLSIRQNSERGLLSLLNGGDLRGFINGGVDLEVLVPHGSSFDIASASADVALNGEFIDVSAKTASGDLRAQGEVFGDLTVKSASGDVRVAHVGGDLSLQTVSGDIAVTAVDGTVKVTSVSGDVELGSLCGGVVRIQSVSGDLELGIAKGSAVDVDASSATGEMHSDVTLSDTLSGEVSGGPTVIIRARTVSGDLHIKRSPERSPLRA